MIAFRFEISTAQGLRFNIALLICTGTDVIVEIPNFDDTYELFRHTNFLVPHNCETDHQRFKQHYEYFATLVPSRLKNALDDTNSTSSKAKEVRSKLDLHEKSFESFKMILSVI